jgi:hypothetical protein
MIDLVTECVAETGRFGVQEVVDGVMEIGGG